MLAILEQVEDGAPAQTLGTRKPLRCCGATALTQWHAADTTVYRDPGVRAIVDKDPCSLLPSKVRAGQRPATGIREPRQPSAHDVGPDAAVRRFVHVSTFHRHDDSLPQLEPTRTEREHEHT